MVGIYITAVHPYISMLYVVNDSFISHTASISDVALQVILSGDFHLNRNSGIQVFLIVWVYCIVASSYLGATKTELGKRRIHGGPQKII